MTECQNFNVLNRPATTPLDVQYTFWMENVMVLGTLQIRAPLTLVLPLRVPSPLREPIPAEPRRPLTK